MATVRVGACGYATHQGLGYLAKHFYQAGVVQRMMIYQHPNGRPTQRDWYPDDTPVMAGRSISGPVVERWLDDLDVVLFYETPHDWAFPRRCHERGVKTAIVTMYEWFLEDPPHKFDLYLCPSALDFDIFSERIPDRRVVHIPIPASPDVQWRLRETATRFVHNAGNVGHREHKGTRELLLAMRHVKADVDLTVRCQNVAALSKLVTETGTKSDRRIRFQYGEVPYATLWKYGDVYVAPEKFNGLSLPLQEAFAAGMAVMTTDRYPANTWLPDGIMIGVKSYQKARVMRGHLEFDEAVVTPEEIADTIDLWYSSDISMFSEAGRQWAEANSWAALAPRYLEELEGVCR